MESEEVSDSYKHPKWQKTRLRVMERDEWSCCACSNKESTLHVHHRAYQGEPWDVPDEWLQTLCESCHGFLGTHPKGGVWWVSEHQHGDKRVIALDWCPQCGGISFEEDSSKNLRCDSCAWNTRIYSGCFVSVGAAIKVGEQQKAEAKKPSCKSIAWLKGIITKARNSGASEEEIWSAAFPDRQFPRALFCVPAVGEWKKGADAGGVIALAAEKVGGLAVDFLSLANSRVYSDCVIEVCFPSDSPGAFEFCSRPQVSDAIRHAASEVCGRQVVIEFLRASRFDEWTRKTGEDVKPFVASQDEFEQFSNF